MIKQRLKIFRNKPKIVLYGAGGHSKEIIDILERNNEYKIIGIIDDDEKKWEKFHFGYRVLGGMPWTESLKRNLKYLVAIGDNNQRKKIADSIESLGYDFGNAVHLSSQFGRDISFGKGNAVMSNANINSGTKIGNHVVLNTGCNVGHESIIEDFCYISPGANIAGTVRIGRLSYIGIGASIIQGIRIGTSCIIGAGAAVISDIPDNSVAVGVPAKIIKENRLE
jgi:acetyltransferase EpsM